MGSKPVQFAPLRLAWQLPPLPLATNSPLTLADFLLGHAGWTHWGPWNLVMRFDL